MIVCTKSEYSKSVRTILELFQSRTFDIGMHSKSVRTLSKPSKTVRTILECDVCEESENSKIPKSYVRFWNNSSIVCMVLEYSDIVRTIPEYFDNLKTYSSLNSSISPTKISWKKRIVAQV